MLNIQKKIEWQDNLLNASCAICTINAQELSSYLKANLLKQNIDIGSFNPDLQISYIRESAIEESPPKEIYEYQNFFLLFDKEKDQYFLLDGFRRLLWYNPPDVDIMVRIYEKQNLTNVKILNLLLDLNHYKFYGGNYTDRGFSLCLKLIFDVDLRKIKNSYNGYMSYKEERMSYSIKAAHRTEENKLVKGKILHPEFLNDLKFLESLSDFEYMSNGLAGRQLYLFREKTDKKASFKKFSEYITNNKKILSPLFKKVDGKVLDGHIKGDINSILDFYENAFKIQLGENTIKTYEELKAECKNLVKQLTKNKDFQKITIRGDHRPIENKILKLYKMGYIPDFKAVVFPAKNGGAVLNPGLYNFDDILIKDHALRGVSIDIYNKESQVYIEHKSGYYVGAIRHITTAWSKLISRKRGGKDVDVVVFANFNNLKLKV